MTGLSVTKRLRLATAIAGKDLTILRRDKAALFSLLGIPLLFATFFGAIFGGTGGDGGKVQPMKIAIVTPLPNAEADAFVERLAAGGGVDVARVPLDEARRMVRVGDRSMYLEILEMPEAGGLLRGVAPRFRMGVDPSRQATRGLVTGLISEATFESLGEVMSDRDLLRKSMDDLSRDLQERTEINVAQRALLKTAFDSFVRFLDDAEVDDGSRSDVGPGTGGFRMRPEIEVETVSREQKRKISSYDISFPQAMAWALMGAAAALALTLVKEARAGTLQRLRTTPVDGQTILLGKTLATALAGAFAVVVLVAIGTVIFGVEIDDPIATGLAVASSAITFAALGTLLGTLGRTEESVSGATWGVLIVCAMLGGGMVPEIVMPSWMRSAAVFSPVRWSIRSLEGATWRAFDYAELLQTCGVLLGFAIAFYVAGAIRMKSLRQ